MSDRRDTVVDNVERRLRYCPACERQFHVSFRRCPQDDTQLVLLGEPDDPLIGKEIDGRYTIKKPLARGGMGCIYTAWQHSVGRDVAIKVILAGANTEEIVSKRFIREATLVSRLSQPNIVSVLDFGQTPDGMLYIVMELLHGKTLAEIIQTDAPVSTERLVRIGVQLCDALEAAHALDIIHRDLKPSNIVILDEPQGRDMVKVLDFGIAKSLAPDASTITEGLRIIGTPKYLPPEVALGQPQDRRSDLYCLGLILYELASGRTPFPAGGAETLLHHHAFDTPAPLHAPVPRVMQNVILRLLAKSRDDRYSSATQVRESLFGAAEQAARSRAPKGAGESPTSKKALPADINVAGSSPDVRRRWWRIGLAAAVVLAVGVALLWIGQVREATKTALRNPDTIREAVASESAVITEAVVRVELTLRSKPPSQVAINGVEIGPTPLVHEMLSSQEAVEIRFTRPGYKATRERVVPDHSQTIAIRLVRRKPAKKSAPNKNVPQGEPEGFILPP